MWSDAVFAVMNALLTLGEVVGNAVLSIKRGSVLASGFDDANAGVALNLAVIWAKG